MSSIKLNNKCTDIKCMKCIKNIPNNGCNVPIIHYI